MGRLLKRLIPQDTKDSINSSPVTEWVVVAILLVVGPLLALKGIGAIREKRLTGKNGQVYEGTTSQLFGAMFVLLGVVLTGAGLVMLVGKVTG